MYSSTQVCRMLQHSSLFNSLVVKAAHMNYWKGEAQMRKNSPLEKALQQLSTLFYLCDKSSCEAVTPHKRGPKRKLSLEQELLAVLMRLRLGLLVEDIAFRFHKASPTLISSIFATWVRFLSKELSWLVMWPSKQQVKFSLPESFRRLHPKVRGIIDCTEVFTETPSNLKLQAILWSDYKHHTTIKFLVCITPNGAVSYISPCYGGRATDKFIVRDCCFLNLVEPYDEIMADRGFKIRDDLLMRQATLSIPPSALGGLQMLSSDVKKTSRIANLRIYVEQAIGRMKVYKILQHELPVKCLPLCDDIVRVCGILVNFRPPLCE